MDEHNSNDHNQSEQERLLGTFDRALSGAATDAEIAALDELLDADPDARALYAEYAKFGVDLRFGFRTGALLGREGVPDQPQPKGARDSRHQLWMRTLSAGFLGALAASVLTAALLLPSTERETVVAPVAAFRPPAPVATLSEHSNAVWRGQQLSLGQSISEGGRVKLLRGTARISVGAGAEILATAPCDLAFESPETVRLHEGEVAVAVAEWATGFTVQTDMMDLEELGATFTVSASPESGVKAKALEGQVRAQRSATGGRPGESVLLSPGEAFAIDNKGRMLGRTTEGIGAGEEFDFGDARPYQTVELHNTGVDIAVGDDDPHWLVVAGPGGRAELPEPAVLCLPDERYLPNDPAVSQWVSVRDSRNAKSDSVYTFQTSFHLDGFDLSTVKLFGRFLADNGIQEVRVNGSPVRVDSWVDNEEGQAFLQPQFRIVNVTGGLVAGVNTIEVDVWNGRFEAPPALRDSPVNPMALRVEWYAFGRQSI